ncbi:MAG: glycosyltransferase family 2 protein [Prosthecobacter sp.]|nr:glycosyltransferase family 2 protein [Prosthecobacter sp.]
MRYDLAIIVPTKNERGNVQRLLELLDAALHDLAWEVIFVDDDSRDGTAEAVRALAADRENVRCLRRIRRQGLASAAIEGMMATGADCIAVMDADLQHDETLLPVMLQRLRDEDLDIVVASRFLQDSRLEKFSSTRERMSRLGNGLSRLLTRCALTDPLSGFFMLKRSLIDEVVPRLNGQGFKILLDIFASSTRPLRFAEVPFVFRQRHSGESKLDTLVSLEFLLLVADKCLGRVMPLRFLTFLLVGFSGLALHLSLLWLFFRQGHLPFYGAQAGATLMAMTSNFFLNNQATYRDRRLKGSALWLGLLSFYAICSIGAFVNFTMADFLFARTVPWMLAGLVGASVSAVWNYGVNSTITWSPKRRS